jgi:hypothetical protein
MDRRQTRSAQFAGKANLAVFPTPDHRPQFTNGPPQRAATGGSAWNSGSSDSGGTPCPRFPAGAPPHFADWRRTRRPSPRKSQGAAPLSPRDGRLGAGPRCAPFPSAPLRGIRTFARGTPLALPAHRRIVDLKESSAVTPLTSDSREQDGHRPASWRCYLLENDLCHAGSPAMSLTTGYCSATVFRDPSGGNDVGPQHTCSA